RSQADVEGRLPDFRFASESRLRRHRLPISALTQSGHQSTVMPRLTEAAVGFVHGGAVNFFSVKNPQKLALLKRICVLKSGCGLRAFCPHLEEQKRVLLDTLRPLRQVGIRAPQLSHWRLAFGSMPASTMTARFSSRSW